MDTAYKKIRSSCLALLESEHKGIVADNLCNSNAENIDKDNQITNKEITFYKTDVMMK